MSGLALLSMGGGIVGVGFIVFREAIEYIVQGDSLLLGLFSGVSTETAVLCKYGGIAGMAVGGVMILAGLIQLVRSK